MNFEMCIFGFCMFIVFCLIKVDCLINFDCINGGCGIFGSNATVELVMEEFEFEIMFEMDLEMEFVQGDDEEG